MSLCLLGQATSLKHFKLANMEASCNIPGFKYVIIRLLYRNPYIRKTLTNLGDTYSNIISLKEQDNEPCTRIQMKYRHNNVVFRI